TKYLPFAPSISAARERALERFLLVLLDCTTGWFHSSNTSKASCSPGRGEAHASLRLSVPRCLAGSSISFQSMPSPPGDVTMPVARPAPFSSVIGLAPFSLASSPECESCATLYAHDARSTSPPSAMTQPLGPTEVPSIATLLR